MEWHGLEWEWLVRHGPAPHGLVIQVRSRREAGLLNKCAIARRAAYG